ASRSDRAAVAHEPIFLGGPRSPGRRLRLAPLARQAGGVRDRERSGPPMTAQRRIAILFHETDRHRPAQGYIVHLLSEYWREWGHDVRFIYGVRQFEAADLLFVHVDLSVVPEEYLEFASRYAVTINGGVDDICKSRISANIVAANNGLRGPVIVKSDLNYAGVPERIRVRSRLEQRWPIIARLQRKVPSRIKAWWEATNVLTSSEDYKIYADLASVRPARGKDTGRGM